MDSCPRAARRARVRVGHCTRANRAMHARLILRLGAPLVRATDERQTRQKIGESDCDSCGGRIGHLGCVLVRSIRPRSTRRLLRRGSWRPVSESCHAGWFGGPAGREAACAHPSGHHFSALCHDGYVLLFWRSARRHLPAAQVNLRRPDAAGVGRLLRRISQVPWIPPALGGRVRQGARARDRLHGPFIQRFVRGGRISLPGADGRGLEASAAQRAHVHVGLVNGRRWRLR